MLLLFVDGVGLGDADAGCNPFLNATLPTFERLLGGQVPLRDSAPLHCPQASLVAVEATLGVDGTPQSGTGQASLFTGANAVAMHGRHFGPWVPAGLQRMVREESVLAQARAAGHRVAFANAYPEEAVALVDRPRAPAPADAAPVTARNGRVGEREEADARRDVRRRHRRGAFLRAGPPLAAIGAGVLTRHTDALLRGDAVASEIVNEGWRQVLGRTGLPVISAAEAGRNLADIAAAHDLTLFAHYATDYAGHRRDMAQAVAALERLDAFLDGVVDALPDDVLLFVVSDHGNIEDTRTGHTRNPALGLVVGEGHALLSRRLRSLTDVAATVLDALAI